MMNKEIQSVIDYCNEMNITLTSIDTQARKFTTKNFTYYFNEVPALARPTGKVITLCGSTKFKDDFIKVQKELTLLDNIVISVGLFGHADKEELSTETKTMLDKQHKRKILMSNEIFVINKGGYIGESTKSEIEYARSLGKLIRYLE